MIEIIAALAHFVNVRIYGEKARDVEARLGDVLEEMLVLMDDARSDKWKKTLARRQAEEKVAHNHSWIGLGEKPWTFKYTFVVDNEEDK